MLTEFPKQHDCRGAGRHLAKLVIPRHGREWLYPDDADAGPLIAIRQTNGCSWDSYPYTRRNGQRLLPWMAAKHVMSRFGKPGFAWRINTLPEWAPVRRIAIVTWKIPPEKLPRFLNDKILDDYRQIGIEPLFVLQEDGLIAGELPILPGDLDDLDDAERLLTNLIRVPPIQNPLFMDLPNGCQDGGSGTVIDPETGRSLSRDRAIEAVDEWEFAPRDANQLLRRARDKRCFDRATLNFDLLTHGYEPELSRTLQIGAIAADLAIKSRVHEDARERFSSVAAGIIKWFLDHNFLPGRRGGEIFDCSASYICARIRDLYDYGILVRTEAGTMTFKMVAGKWVPAFTRSPEYRLVLPTVPSIIEKAKEVYRKVKATVRTRTASVMQSIEAWCAKHRDESPEPYGSSNMGNSLNVPCVRESFFDSPPLDPERPLSSQEEALYAACLAEGGRQEIWWSPREQPPGYPAPLKLATTG